MKSLLTIVAAAAASLFIGGCTTASLNPLATPETVATDPELVGHWVEADKPDTTYVVTQGGEKDYVLRCIPKDGSRKTLEYSFQIVKLADTRFIDLTVTKGAMDELSDKYGTVVVPAHVFIKIRRKGDELNIWQVKNDWLIDGLKGGTIKLAHATVRSPSNNDNEEFVLTGPTTELQFFFRTNAENEEAFDKAITMRRDTAEETKPAPTKDQKAK